MRPRTDVDIAVDGWMTRPLIGRIRVVALVSAVMLGAAACSAEGPLAVDDSGGSHLVKLPLVKTPSEYDGISSSKRRRHEGSSSSSSPIALSRDDSLLWAVDPDSDSISIVRTDTNAVVGRVRVGRNPQSVALDPFGRYAYVANARSNDVSVIRADMIGREGVGAGVRDRRVVTGAAPSSVVVSPDGRSVFVANGSQDTITVLDGRDQRVVAVVDLRNSACNADDVLRHFEPRGLAVSEDSKRLYVTRFLSYTRPGGVQRDDYGKEGMVCRVDLDSVPSGHPHLVPVTLAPSNTGFVDRNGEMTGAFPNQLGSIVLRDGHAYLPNIAASPRGPLHFDVDTEAYVNRIDAVDSEETDGGSLNLHLGARTPEAGKAQLFFANPWGIAFTTPSGRGTAYVVSAASDLLVKLDVDQGGQLHFTVDDSTTRYIDLNDPDTSATSGVNAGKNPIGIVLNHRGTKAYVLNYVSRNVSIVDLSRDRVEEVVSVDSLPAPGSREEVLLVGAELFFSSRGNFVRPEGAHGSSRNRMSENGRQACSSCHSAGRTDGVVWQFASGPRKTIAINGTTDPRDSSRQRILNASAIFDEFEDADFNTRRVSSGEPLTTPRVCVDATPPSGLVEGTNDPDHGLILGEENDFSMAACVLVPFATPNENRPQLRVQLPGSDVKVKATDALKEWQRSAVVTPNRPMTMRELTAAGLTGPGLTVAELKAGRALFEAAGCSSCHGTTQWTTKIKDFVSPPAPEEVAKETATGANAAPYLYRFLTDVGTFELNVPGANNPLPGFPLVGGVEKDTNELEALGFDYDGDGKGNGYNTPSLLGTYGAAAYFHNGACETLLCVLAHEKHRRAGQPAGLADPLDSDFARTVLARYLESIDLETEPHGSGASAAR